MLVISIDIVGKSWEDEKIWIGLLGILRVIIGIFLTVRDLIGGVGGFVIIRMRDWVVILGKGFSCYLYIFKLV